MPFNSDAERRRYQNERYRRKKLARQKELDKLNDLRRKLQFSSLTKDESAIYQVLVEKYAEVLEKERQREKGGSHPADDSDISMYENISRDERIIKSGDGVKSNDISVLKAPTPTTPPTENIPKTKPSSWAKTVVYDEKLGEYVELEKEEDAGNVVNSPWKFTKSIYEKN